MLLPLTAQSARLINDKPITVGDDIIVELSGNKDEISKQNFGDFTLRGISENPDGSLTLTLTAFKTGQLKLALSGNEPLNIDVTSVLDPQNPPQDILDIAPVIKFAKPFIWYLKIFGIILLALGAAYLIYALIKKRKSAAKTAPPPELLIPPKEYALSELERLKSAKLLEKNLAKEHYDKLSDIVRFYLSRVYGVDLMEKTTSEIYGIFKSILQTADNKALKNFLQTCDFVKFAKFTPSIEEAEEDFETAKGLVEKL